MWSELQEKSAEELIEREKQSGIEKYGTFVDKHQGWAIILEEAEEASEEMEHMNSALDAMKKEIFRDNDEIAFDLSHSVYTYAKRLMLEAMQTAAMASKYMESFEKELSSGT